ncbi:MAG TPA: 6-phosphogluconolactonase [bacterium]|nr:6-phosphogluconolactonase [bacterium]
MNPDFQVFPDRAALAAAAAAHILDVAGAAIDRGGICRVALSGGQTPEPVYRLLVSARIDWYRVHLFWTDERCVPPDHPESNYGMARRALLDHVPAPPGNVHRIHGEDPPAQAAADYERQLRDHFGAPLPRFDLILLGLGADGHTASLFPNSTALREHKRLVTPVQHPATGQWRVTLTLPSLNAAVSVAVLASGADKAEAVRQTRSGSEPSLPLAQVHPADGHLRWFVDRAATGEEGGERRIGASGPPASETSSKGAHGG